MALARHTARPPPDPPKVPPPPGLPSSLRLPAPCIRGGAAPVGAALAATLLPPSPLPFGPPPKRSSDSARSTLETTGGAHLLHLASKPIPLSPSAADTIIPLPYSCVQLRSAGADQHRQHLSAGHMPQSLGPSLGTKITAGSPPSHCPKDRPASVLPPRTHHPPRRATFTSVVTL